MREAGLAVWVDAAGNVIGRREAGRVEEKTAGKTFAIGSHLDTVPNAGKYDGILGVVAGIELAELMRDVALPFALEVVGFSEEEGVRFGKPYIGSHAYAGTLDAEWLGLKDKNGVSAEEAIRVFGLDPAPLRSLVPRADLLGYFELHIEQGPVLESENVAIGVVTAIAAQTRMSLEAVGRADHAGTTPMNLRKDALACVAEMIGAIENLTGSSKPHGWASVGGVATVGRLEVRPNATNVVPEVVRFSLDVRNATLEGQTNAIELLLKAFQSIAQLRGIQFSILERTDFPPTAMRGTRSFLVDSREVDCKGVMRTVHTYKKSNIDPRWLSSGAGHDAAILAKVCPTAMVFVRSRGGISHSPLESILPMDVRIALAHTCAAVKALAEDPTDFLSATQESA